MDVNWLIGGKEGGMMRRGKKGGKRGREGGEKRKQKKDVKIYIVRTVILTCRRVCILTHYMLIN